MANASKKRTEERPRNLFTVMENILLFIKHHFRIIWRFIEWGNGIAFSVIFKSRMEKSNTEVISAVNSAPFIYKRLSASDMDQLSLMIERQKESDLKYFNAHGFTKELLYKQLRNPSFLMMGVYHSNQMVGYFFLRFFANKKCFVGRLIDKPFRGRGIGETMNKIMYETAWNMGFRCLSTISRNNKAVMNSHSRNKNMIILKELRNDYLLVEFIRNVDQLTTQP